MGTEPQVSGALEELDCVLEEELDVSDELLLGSEPVELLLLNTKLEELSSSLDDELSASLLLDELSASELDDDNDSSLELETASELLLLCTSLLEELSVTAEEEDCFAPALFSSGMASKLPEQEVNV